MQRVYSVQSAKPTHDQLALQETVFHNANGYLGVRGTLEEGAPEGMDTMRGAYVNGFYETVPMKQAEKLTHVREEKESMINAADVQGVRLCLAGEWFAQWTGELLRCERLLDMDRGITERRVTWRSPQGRETALCFRRMASFAQPSLFLIDCEITPLNYAGEVEVESTHLALVKNYANPNDPRLAGESECHLAPAGSLIEDGASYLSVRTRVSGLSLTTGVRHAMEPSAQDTRTTYDSTAHATTFRASITLRQGQTLRLQKYCVFSDERRYGDTLAAARQAMAGAFGRAEALYRAQQDTLAAFWENADTTILGDDDANLSMQFNLYQLFQSAGRDGLCSIAAKGLSGEGYEGHYFWDTEMYMLPFFVLTMPQLARKLLGYRYRTLDAARENARLLGHLKGALYPWRTIDGRECSGYFLAGTAQYHIVGDIAYAVGAYYNATGDREYLISEGAEMLLETARLWMDVGHMAQGRFCINCVTGPDEYTCMVNNNYYTNACAKNNLEWAVHTARLLREWGAYESWANKLGVTQEELDGFARAAKAMYLPYDEELGINPQDDSFLHKPVWDLASTPRDKFPLLLNYHPLQLYRYQVCKQADTVLAHVLFEDLASKDVRERSFRYYEKITTHDSSLSNCIFCIEACRLGLRREARDYFGDSVKTDLLNTHGKSKDGIHTANMGGCYMAVVNGFAGLRLCQEGVRVDPFLLEGWTGLQFSFQYRGSHLRFEMEGEHYRVRLLAGGPVSVITPECVCDLERPGDEAKGMAR
ncbi:MAG: family 65 glycosyl hydrolase [Clostridiales bacterium]|nr:family 65 glycosyl hydrolase [Clostridiales bacterium]